MSPAKMPSRLAPERQIWRCGGIALLLALAVSTLGEAREHRAPWIGSWATANLAPDSQAPLASQDYPDATLRQVIRLSVGGEQVRLRVSNRFGAGPLTLKAARIAVSAAPNTARIDPNTDRAVTFAGRASVVVPQGADYWSDPVRLPVADLSSLAISLVYADAPSGQTGHPGSRATTYLLAGDHAGDVDLVGARTLEQWRQIAGVEVIPSRKTQVLVAFGDSITDGYGVQANTNRRWTDFLAERLVGQGVAVLNLGIGGNRVLADGLGPGGLARFEADVLSQAGVTHVLVLEGVNDLGTLTRQTPAAPPQAHMAVAEQLIGAYRQMIDRARARGVHVLGATIPPYGGSGYYHATPQSEAARQMVNAWIRAPGHFDSVVDWDRILRDPARPTHLNPLYDNDGLHPSIAGYQAMAGAIPASLLSAPAAIRR